MTGGARTPKTMRIDDHVPFFAGVLAIGLYQSALHHVPQMKAWFHLYPTCDGTGNGLGWLASQPAYQTASLLLGYLIARWAGAAGAWVGRLFKVVGPAVVAVDLLFWLRGPAELDTGSLIVHAVDAVPVLLETLFGPWELLWTDLPLCVAYAPAHAAAALLARALVGAPLDPEPLGRAMLGVAAAAAAAAVAMVALRKVRTAAARRPRGGFAAVPNEEFYL